MNILALTDIVPYPPNTGIKIRTYNTLRQLSLRGHRIFLVSFNQPILIPDDGAKEACQRALLRDFAEVHILDIPSERSRLKAKWTLLLGAAGPKPYRVYRYSSRECTATVRDIASRVPVDLVHLDKTELFQYARLVPGVPAIATNHNVESLLFRRRARYDVTALRRAFSRIQAAKTARYERRVLQHSPAYITCTRADADTFLTTLGVTTPAVIIENGVDIAHYRPLDGPKENYVLLIGAQSLAATGNYDATMWFYRDMWPAIRRADSHVELRIVGRHPDPSVLALAAQDPRVKVLGFLDDEREVLGRAKLLLVPLRVGGGSRLKIVTAMAMGTAVVSTTIGAEGIDCRPGHDIAVADTPETFAAATASLLNDESSRTQQEARARQLVESVYDWGVIGDKLDAFYRGVVESAGPGGGRQLSDLPAPGQ